MSRVRIWPAVIYAKSGATFLARITGHDGELVTQASLSAISYEVWCVSDDPEEQEKEETALVVSSVIFDTLQVDSRWTLDATGYNFRASLPAAAFDDSGDKIYSIEFRFTPVSGEVFRLAFRAEALRIYSAA